MPRYLDQLVLDEGQFSSEQYNGMQANGLDAIVRQRRSPLLITAPHATKHGRFGQIKEEDEFTGSLALLLGRELDASVIVAAHCNPDLSNPAELSADFYKAFTEFAPQHKFIVDVHGMSNKHGSGICIGTGSWEPSGSEVGFAVDIIMEEMAEFTPQINVPFSAQAPYTLVHLAKQEHQIPGVQLELAKMFRSPSQEFGKKHALFLDRLISSLHRISAILL